MNKKAIIPANRQLARLIPPPPPLNAEAICAQLPVQLTASPNKPTPLCVSFLIAFGKFSLLLGGTAETEGAGGGVGWGAASGRLSTD